MTFKKQFHDQLVSLLLTIGGVQKVIKRYLSFDEILIAPILSVIRGNTIKEISGNADLYKVETTFEILCYIKTSYDVEDTGLLTDEAERLLELVEEKILQDETIYDLGAVKIELTNEEIIPDYEHNLCYAGVSLTITYFTNENI